MRYSLFLLAFAVLPASALPIYSVVLSGAGFGFGEMTLNSTSTGGSVSVSGTYTGSGSLTSNILVGGALVPRDSFDFAFPDFGYVGTIFFATPCCNFSTFYVDSNSSLGGVFEPPAQPILRDDPPPPIFIIDTPEPGTAGLALIGLSLLAAWRRRHL